MAKRVFLINVIMFCTIWLAIFIWGADRDLPDQFWKLALLTFFIGLQQALFAVYWLKYPKLWLSGLFFGTGMLALNLLFFRDLSIWTVFMVVIGLAYGLFFQVFNSLLVTLLKKKTQHN